jgi:hypothetical protein
MTVVHNGHKSRWVHVWTRNDKVGRVYGFISDGFMTTPQNSTFVFRPRSVLISLTVYNLTLVYFQQCDHHLTCLDGHVIMVCIASGCVWVCVCVWTCCHDHCLISPLRSGHSRFQHKPLQHSCLVPSQLQGNANPFLPSLIDNQHFNPDRLTSTSAQPFLRSYLTTCAHLCDCRTLSSPDSVLQMSSFNRLQRVGLGLKWCWAVFQVYI